MAHQRRSDQHRGRLCLCQGLRDPRCGPSPNLVNSAGPGKVGGGERVCRWTRTRVSLGRRTAPATIPIITPTCLSSTVTVYWAGQW